MKKNSFCKEIERRRTFAIISHPDAGKTTITEKFLLFGRVIQKAGTVKSRGSNQYVKSDWMEMEKRRGISITTSVMQFSYKDFLMNLLDTPGHEDFSEDTYRSLTAVDCCLMVIDAAKGVEDRTRKLIEVTRLRDTPIITFMNKLDRDIDDSIEVIEEIERELNIACSPITWPIGCGKFFKGVYHLYRDETILYQSGRGHAIQEYVIIKGLNNTRLNKVVGHDCVVQLLEELELVKSVSHVFNLDAFLQGKLTPVFFGTALGNFGIDHILDALISWAPKPMSRHTDVRIVNPKEEKFSGFVFKIQANMDLKHRDRVAFLRIVSGSYKKGMKLYQVRNKKELVISDALTFIAGDRFPVKEAFPGDIIGLHNHGTIQIGDTFTQGELLKFRGIPNFSPELFKRIRLRDPLKQKQLVKGLVQLSEEGAVQIFRPLSNNEIIVGAVGILQFDMIVARLKSEYNIEAMYESIQASPVRWITCDNVKQLEEFKRKHKQNLALDGDDQLSYIAPTMVNLNIISKRYPEIQFCKTREHQ